MLDYSMEHVFSYTAQLSEPEVIGPVAEGIRANYYITGGTVSGPKIQGSLRAAGGDWMLLRQDGVVRVNVLGTIETDDGAIIDLRYEGLADLGENGYQDFAAGNLPATAAIRAAPQLSTAHPAYLWLNRHQFVNIGEVDFATLLVSYDVYALG